MKAAIHRCPFCNSHNVSLESNAISHWIKCLSCYACGPITLRKKVDAVRNWNGGATSSAPDSLVGRNRQRDTREVELG